MMSILFSIITVIYSRHNINKIDTTVLLLQDIRYVLGIIHKQSKPSVLLYLVVSIFTDIIQIELV